MMLVLSILSFFLFITISSSSSPSSSTEKKLNIPLPHLKRLIEKVNLKGGQKRYFDDDATCPNRDDITRQVHPEKIEPESPFCRMYSDSSCCSYKDTFRVQYELFSAVFMRTENNVTGYFPECYDALESFFCYPCDPTYGNFLYPDDTSQKMVWRICKSTCKFLVDHCSSDEVFVDYTAEELCDEIEKIIEQQTYETYDIVQVEDDDDDCFKAINYDAASGVSGCGIFLILVFVAIVVVVVFVVLIFFYRRWREKADSETVTDESPQSDLYKI